MVTSPVNSTTWDHSEHIARFADFGLLQDGSAIVRPLAVLGLFSPTYWLAPEDAVKYAAALNRRRYGAERWAHLSLFFLGVLLIWYSLPASLALPASIGVSVGAGWHVRRLVMTWFRHNFASAQRMRDPHFWQRLEMASVTSPYLVLSRVLWLVTASVCLGGVVLLALAGWSLAASVAAAVLLVPFALYQLWLLVLHALFRIRNGRSPQPADAAAFHRQLGYLDIPYAKVV